MEGRGGEDTFAVHFCADEQADSTDAVEGDLESGAVPPVAYFGHVPPVGFELRVAYLY